VHDLPQPIPGAVARRHRRGRPPRRDAGTAVLALTLLLGAAGAVAASAAPATAAEVTAAAAAPEPAPAPAPAGSGPAAPPQQTAGDPAAAAPAPQPPGDVAASSPAPPAVHAPETGPGSVAAAPPPAPGANPAEAAPPPPLRDPVGTRLIDVATPFTLGSRWLELLVTHRFIQPFNQGGSGHNLWGLDSGADVGIGFTYGIVQRLDVSVYRSAFQEDFELAAKVQVLQQAPHMPLSLAVRAGADMLGRHGVEDPHRPFAQLLLGCRLAPGWNVFVSPSWVHATPLLRNAWNAPVGITAPLPGRWLVEAEGIAPNHALHATTGASRFAWHAAFSKPIGWHLFQILIGNSRATTVDQIVGGDFAGGFTTHDLRLGFNLVRYFAL
jgi:hypothetical protein